MLMLGVGGGMTDSQESKPALPEDMKYARCAITQNALFPLSNISKKSDDGSIGREGRLLPTVLGSSLMLYRVGNSYCYETNCLSIECAIENTVSRIFDNC